MSDVNQGKVTDTSEVVGNDTQMLEKDIASNYLKLRNDFVNNESSMTKDDAISVAGKLFKFTDALIEIFAGNKNGLQVYLSQSEEKMDYLESFYNPNFPSLNCPGNYFFLDTAGTVDKNEIVDPRIMELELQAVANAPDDSPICFAHHSGRGLDYVKEKHKKPMEEMALKMNFTPEQMDKIRKRIIFGPEMNLFSLSMFSDEIIKNLSENHPAWKKENKQKMDNLYMDIDLLPQTAPETNWVPCMDADGNKAFWCPDETVMRDWYRDNGLPIPAILSAFASKCKMIMPTGEKVLIWDETKQAWVVPFMPDHPRMQRDAKINSDYIKANKLDHVYCVEQVTTAFNNLILDEDGQIFCKGTSAYKSALYFSKITKKPLVLIRGKSKTAGDSDTDSEMAEAINCGFVLVDSRTNPGKRTLFHMIGKAKQGFNGPDVTYEFLKKALAWLPIKIQ